MAKNKTSKSKAAAQGLPKAMPVVPVMVVWHPEAVVDLTSRCPTSRRANACTHPWTF
jgi:hypothetical protein